MERIRIGAAMKRKLAKTTTFVLGVMFLASPLHTQAAQTDTLVKNTLSDPVGVASLMQPGMTEDEYIQTANDAQESFWGYTNIGIAQVDNNLNIRETPDESGKLVGKLPKDAACEILSTEGNWAYIHSGKVDGYVSMDYLLTGVDAKLKARELVKTVATVTTDALKIREEPNTECGVLTLVPMGEELEVVEVLDGWVKINLDGEDYYVSADYVEVGEKLETAVTMTELLYGQGVSDLRVDLCQYAKQFLGNPYVWGGTSLTNGADCSGFVLSAYKNFGYTLPHYSGSQANMGTKISLSEAQPGDLIFYGKNGTINHVAIYIGNGQVIHASSPTTGIRISNSQYRTPLKVVKILP